MGIRHFNLIVSYFLILFLFLGKCHVEFPGSLSLQSVMCSLPGGGPDGASFQVQAIHREKQGQISKIRALFTRSDTEILPVKVLTLCQKL